MNTNKLLLILLLVPLLTGCQTYDSHEARMAQQQLVGLSKAELHLCAGLPTKTETLGMAEYDTYEYSLSNSSGLSLELPVIGGFSLASNGYCHATFKLNKDQVTEVDYAGDTGGALGHVANCSSIVDHCLNNEAEAKGTD